MLSTRGLALVVRIEIELDLELRQYSRKAVEEEEEEEEIEGREMMHGFKWKTKMIFSNVVRRSNAQQRCCSVQLVLQSGAKQRSSENKLFKRHMADLCEPDSKEASMCQSEREGKEEKRNSREIP